MGRNVCYSTTPFFLIREPKHIAEANDQISAADVAQLLWTKLIVKHVGILHPNERVALETIYLLLIVWQKQIR